MLTDDELETIIQSLIYSHFEIENVNADDKAVAKLIVKLVKENG